MTLCRDLAARLLMSLVPRGVPNKRQLLSCIWQLQLTLRGVDQQIGTGQGSCLSMNIRSWDEELERECLRHMDSNNTNNFKKRALP